MPLTSLLREDSAPEGDNLLIRVSSILRSRKLRSKYFNGGLFADPAWDLLLEPFKAHLEQRRISASALFQAGGVPQSTNFRWLAKLEADGLIERHADPLDARRSWVHLSSGGLASMLAYFRDSDGSMVD